MPFILREEKRERNSWKWQKLDMNSCSESEEVERNNTR